MEVKRIFDLRQFDRTSRRFRDVVFRNSAKPDHPSTTPDARGGFSVFDTACACPGESVASNCVCRHIAQFYSAIAPEPCVYWVFDPAIFNSQLPGSPEPVLVKIASKSGDDCHRNMHNVSDTRFDKFRRKQLSESNLRICVDGRSEPFSADREIELYNRHFPDPA